MSKTLRDLYVNPEDQGEAPARDFPSTPIVELDEFGDVAVTVSPADYRMPPGTLLIGLTGPNLRDRPWMPHRYASLGDARLALRNVARETAGKPELQERGRRVREQERLLERLEMSSYALLLGQEVTPEQLRSEIGIRPYRSWLLLKASARDREDEMLCKLVTNAVKARHRLEQVRQVASRRDPDISRYALPEIVGLFLEHHGSDLEAWRMEELNLALAQIRGCCSGIYLSPPELVKSLKRALRHFDAFGDQLLHDNMA